MTSWQSCTASITILLFPNNFLFLHITTFKMNYKYYIALICTHCTFYFYFFYFAMGRMVADIVDWQGARSVNCALPLGAACGAVTWSTECVMGGTWLITGGGGTALWRWTRWAGPLFQSIPPFAPSQELSCLIDVFEISWKWDVIFELRIMHNLFAKSLQSESIGKSSSQ